MNKLISAIVACLLLWSCANDKKETAGAEKDEIKIDSTLITDSSWGPVPQNADFESLNKIYGAENVKDQWICGPECIDSINVTIVRSGTDKEFIVYWQDTAFHKTIWMIEASEPKAPYRTSEGLRVGSTLSDILKINGNKITFSGFGWDYGGYIQSYNGGALEKSSIHFRLDMGEGGDNGLMGDIELNTDMPAVKSAIDKIKIWRINFTPNN